MLDGNNSLQQIRNIIDLTFPLRESDVQGLLTLPYLVTRKVHINGSYLFQFAHLKTLIHKNDRPASLEPEILKNGHVHSHVTLKYQGHAW